MMIIGTDIIFLLAKFLYYLYNMKIIAIGDIHGRQIWKRIVEKHKDADKIIFVGDYFDSHDINGVTQLYNFNEIVKFKEDNLEQVVLLTGNHDYHYITYPRLKYSGYNEARSFDFEDALRKAIKKHYMQMCYKYENYLFTHAGVTKTWVSNNNIDINNIDESINDHFIYKPGIFEFNSGENMSPYGDDITQTPIWVRPESLEKDGIDGYIQIVGHTAGENVRIYDKIVLIDALEFGEYIKIENKQITVLNEK